MASRRLVERVAQLVAGQLAERLEQGDIEIAADHSGGDEHALRRLAEALDPAADQTPHALCELEVFLGEARLHPRAAAEHGLRLSHIEEGLLDEERVALGGGLDADHLNRGQRRFDRQSREHLLDLAVGQAAHRDALRAAPAQEA